MRVDTENFAVALRAAMRQDPDVVSTLHTTDPSGTINRLLRDGVITLEAAMSASTSPRDFTVELRRLGLVA